MNAPRHIGASSIFRTLDDIRAALQVDQEALTADVAGLLQRLQRLHQGIDAIDTLMTVLKEEAGAVPATESAEMDVTATVSPTPAEEPDPTPAAIPTPEPEHTLGAPTPDPAPAAVVDEKQCADLSDEEIEAMIPKVFEDGPEPGPSPWPEFPQQGPYPAEFLIACYEEYEGGATVREISQRYPVHYPFFAKAFKEFREGMQDDGGEQPEPEPAPEPEPEPQPEPAPDTGKVALWDDRFMARRLVEYEGGMSVAEIASLHGLQLKAFAKAFQAFRQKGKPVKAASKPVAADWEPGKKPLVDPDPDRAASGWSLDDDIKMLTDLGLGLTAQGAATRLLRDKREIVARYTFLCPDKTSQQQGRVIETLRRLKDAEAAE